MKKKTLIVSIASLAVAGTVLFSCGKTDSSTQDVAVLQDNGENTVTVKLNTPNIEIEVSEQIDANDPNNQDQAVQSLAWIKLGNSQHTQNCEKPSKTH